MAMQKVISNQTYMKCLALAQTAMERPNGIFIQCGSKADAVRYRALFFSVRKKIGYNEGQIPSMALGLFTVEFRIKEEEDGTAQLHIRRAGASLEDLNILDAEGNRITTSGVKDIDIQKEKTEYLIQLERIKYFISTACPGYEREATAGTAYATAMYFYEQGTRIFGYIDPLYELELKYNSSFALVEAKVYEIGEAVNGTDIKMVPKQAWADRAVGMHSAAALQKKESKQKEREEQFNLAEINLLSDEA
ncbi:MAG TPA: hypothetical protein VMT20_15405 [Terriglobia bacterium]|nr:hypothetical protein [Terriglobia bacterium]